MRKVSSPVSGVLIWIAFAIVAVLCRGARWDETYEHAQILAGWVAYPSWHPLPTYVASVFSLQTRLSAWLLEWTGSPAFLCGFRNVLFLLSTILPVFLITTTLTGKARWGHLAALLMLQGIFLEFDGSYPTFVWPELYSNGHIGGGVALLTVWALVFGHCRLGGLLLGLMPAVHLGQFPPVLALAGCMAAVWMHLRKAHPRAAHENRSGRPTQYTWIAYLGAGALVSLAVWWLSRVDGQLAAPDAAEALWRDYTFHHDPHRRFPPGNGHIILAGTLLLSALRGRRGADRGWLGVYALVIAALVWGTMALHAVLGEHLPFAFIVWMPYRLINHIPPLCMAIVAATLAKHKRGNWLLVAGLAACMLVSHLGPLGDGAIFRRYFAHGEWLAFLLFGAALPMAARGRARFAAPVIAALVLAPFHQFGAACLILGALGPVTASRWQCPDIRHMTRPATVGALAALSGFLLLFHQEQQHAWLPVTPFQRSISESTPQDAVLLGPPESYMLQAKTHRAVLAEAATPSLISYLPRLAPHIDTMYRDCYGITFSVPAPPEYEKPWTEVWRMRDRQAWIDLAGTYEFSHVLAPPGVTLRLPITTEDASEGTLYRVP